MPLEIIKGPPNSGRTELLRQMYVDSLRRNPVLVVPSVDDIFTWEERLTRKQGAHLGGKVVHFRDLVTTILGRDPNDRSGIAGPLRRRALATAALRDGWPGLANRLARQPGLVEAALRAFDDLRAGLVRPDDFSEAARNDGNDESVLHRVGEAYRRYIEGLAALGLKDDAALALDAFGAPLTKWQGRPVFLAGFDDLTELQLRLLTRLAAETDVTIVITHENDSRAMAVTDLLLSRLADYAALPESDRPRLKAADAGRDRLLHQVEKRFLRDSPGKGQLDPSEAITLIEASGRRGEAEAVGAEIARLIAGDVPPDEIAIAVDSPSTQGGVFRDVLAEYEITSTLECETSAPATAAGQAVIDLLRAASPGGSATGLIRYLRGPVGADRDAADRTELRVVRSGTTTAVEAAAIYERISGDEAPFFGELREGDPAVGVRGLLRTMPANLLSQSGNALPGPELAIETRMIVEIRRAMDELELIHGKSPDRDLLLETLLGPTVSVWAVPAANTVHIASPYSLRAKRVGFLFMVSLQEGDPGAGDDAGGPFLNRAIRSKLRLTQPNDPEDQERYLFHSCLSVPTHGLYLSCRIADENGAAEYPSPMIEAVTGLFKAQVDENGNRMKPGIRTIRRTGSNAVFSPGSAPVEAELFRSLAARSAGGDESPLPVLPGYLAERAETLISRAKQLETETRTLTDLTLPEVTADLDKIERFGATTLEAFTGCPYRWFIERGLRPQRFAPEPEALARGGIIHQALFTIFSERTGTRPRPETLDEWLSAVEPAVEAAALETGLAVELRTPADRVMIARAATDIATQIRREAGFDPKLDPALFEASFGLADSKVGPLDMGSWSLVGIIDRVDVSGGIETPARGVVIDYKSGNSSVKTWQKIKEARRLQLQLYLKALKELWGIEPMAGLYQPVCRGKRQPRGPIEESDFGDVAFMDAVRTDRVDMAAVIRDAVDLADETVARIRTGRIQHDPAACPDHFRHPAVPDWVPESKNGDAQ